MSRRKGNLFISANGARIAKQAARLAIYMQLVLQLTSYAVQSQEATLDIHLQNNSVKVHAKVISGNKLELKLSIKGPIQKIEAARINCTGWHFSANRINANTEGNLHCNELWPSAAYTSHSFQVNMTETSECDAIELTVSIELLIKATKITNASTVSLTSHNFRMLFGKVHAIDSLEELLENLSW